MDSNGKKPVPWKRIYLNLIGLGLWLFGIFAIFFRTYDHPIYGHIDLGENHVLIGIGFLILGAVYMVYIKHKAG